MQPTAQIAQDGLRLMKDVLAPHDAEHQANASLPKTPISPELVRYIPVKKPAPSVAAQAAANPISASSKSFTEEPPRSDDKELDQILQDASSAVKSPEQKAKSRLGFGKKLFKNNANKAETKKVSAQKKPLLAIVMAVAVAGTLSATAIWVYGGSSFSFLNEFFSEPFI